MEHLSQTPPEKLDRRIRRSRTLIKTTLLTLMIEKKTSKITVSELTSRADINRKTFYNHYSDINSVLLDIENELSDKILSHVPVEEFGNHPENIVGSIMEELNKNLDFYRLMVESEVHEQWFRQFKNRLVESILRSKLRDFFTQNPSMEFYLDFICTGFMAAVRHFLEEPRGMSNEQFCQMMSLQFQRASEAFLSYSGFHPEPAGED